MGNISLSRLLTANGAISSVNAPALVCALLLCTLCCNTSARADVIQLLVPADKGIYSSFHQAFKQHLLLRCKHSKTLQLCHKLDDNLQVTPIADTPPFSRSERELVIALGSSAGEYLARQSADAKLFTLIPQESYQRLQHCCLKGQKNRVSAIYIDQPIERYLLLIKKLLPEKKRVAVLLSANNDRLKKRLSELMKKHGLTLVAAKVTDSSEVGSTLKALLEKSDVLLAIPDALIYNQSTIANIMLTTYRYNIPVIGYSDAMVKAGATAAVFTDIRQLAHATAEKTIDYFLEGQLTKPHYTNLFSVKINRDVARSLGIELVSETELERAIRNDLK